MIEPGIIAFVLKTFPIITKKPIKQLVNKIYDSGGAGDDGEHDDY